MLFLNLGPRFGNSEKIPVWFAHAQKQEAAVLLPGADRAPSCRLAPVCRRLKLCTRAGKLSTRNNAREDASPRSHWRRRQEADFDWTDFVTL